MTLVRIAALSLALGTAPALAQQPANQTGNTGAAAQQLPEQCRKMSQQQAQPNMPMMQGTTGMAGNMPPANRDYMQAMQKMSPPMMAAMTIPDPDVAFLCSMISHHHGGIDMARAVIRHGKDGAVKKKAEQTIEEQERDIGEMTELLKKHAK